LAGAATRSGVTAELSVTVLSPAGPVTVSLPLVGLAPGVRDTLRVQLEPGLSWQLAGETCQPVLVPALTLMLCAAAVTCS
jgi:hypothetical protein